MPREFWECSRCKRHYDKSEGRGSGYMPIRHQVTVTLGSSNLPNVWWLCPPCWRQVQKVLDGPMLEPDTE